MKRSDALELIDVELFKCNGTYKSSREKTAERILKSLEEAGMLPPGKLIVPKGSECRKWQTNIEFYTTCKWEEE